MFDCFVIKLYIFLQIHSFYQRCRTALCNCGAAVRSGNSLFVANFCGNNNYVTQNICNKNDISVEKNGNGYWVSVIFIFHFERV